MNITNLEIQPLEIPFRTSFKHSSAEIKSTASVLVKTVTQSGCEGIGEGCPRPYVTREDIGSCLAYFARHREQVMLRIHSYADLKTWVNEHEAEIDSNPAAWCALELSLLDALAKDSAVTPESLLGLRELQGIFAYTAVLGEADREVTRIQISRYAALGMGDFKIKISGDPVWDNERIALIKASVGDARVRMDANNLWSHAQDVLDYLGKLDALPFAIEEPLDAMDYPGMVELFRQSGVRLILDESFLGTRQFTEADKLGSGAVINLRVSKMGGLIRSLEVAREAAARGIPMIVGAHVGETSILTRAALTIAGGFRSNLVAQEGAFGTLLLETDTVSQPLMFGAQGEIKVNDMTPGQKFSLSW